VPPFVFDHVSLSCVFLILFNRRDASKDVGGNVIVLFVFDGTIAISMP
jgi:hypothetical protein